MTRSHAVTSTTATTLGTRWTEKWSMHVAANNVHLDRQKSTFLLLIGDEVLEVRGSLRASPDNATLEQVIERLKGHFLTTKQYPNSIKQ